MARYVLNIPVCLLMLLASLTGIATGVVPPSTDKSVTISYNEEKLETILTQFAEQRGSNILFPQAPDQVEKFKQQKITYQPDNPEQLPVSEAWDLVLLFVKLSGFDLVTKEPKLYAVVPTGSHEEAGSVWREPLPLYIDTASVLLPQNSEPIRYVYYFTELNATDNGEENSQIKELITALSSSGAPPPLFLKNPNGILIIDRADHIAWLIHVLKALESYTGKKYRSTVEVIQLYHLSAVDVAQTLELLKKAAGLDANPTVAAEGEEEEEPAENGKIKFGEVKIVPFAPSNQLIFTGPEESINFLTEFIQKELDVPAARGKSILHTYDLEFISANECAKALTEILSAQRGKQSEEEGDQNLLGGLKRVIIAPLASEYIPQNVSIPDWRNLKQPKGLEVEKIGIQQAEWYGEGNRLLIAASENEWLEIEKIIQELDRREPQVLLEAAVVEFTYDRSRIIAAQTTRFGLLTSNIVPPAFVLGPNPTTLTTDLLATTGTRSIPPQLTIGSTLVAFGDCEVSPVFSLIQFLDQFLSSRILIQPHVMTTNNKQAIITENIIRRARGDVQTGNSGIFVIPVEEIKSTLKLYFIPQIARDANSVKLTIGFGLVDFIGSTLNRRNRMLKTTVTLKNNQVLAIGGLMRTDTTASEFARPLLGHIPILRIFFTGRREVLTKRNLLILVKPTIVKPREQKEVLDQYTADQTQIRLNDLNIELINERQPLLNMFFAGEGAADNLIYEYFDQSNLPEQEKIRLLDTKKKRRKRRKRPLSEKLKQMLANESSPISSY